MDDFQIPHDADLEEYLIGCMIYDPVCIAEVVENLKPSAFYSPSYSRVCKEIFRLWTEDEKQIDFIQIGPVLVENGVTISRMTEVISSIVTTNNVDIYAQQLNDLAALRAAVIVGRELAGAGGIRDKESIREVINKAEGKLSLISETTIKVETMSSMKTALQSYHEEFEKNYYSSSSGITGVPSGYTDLDNMTSGFQKTDLIILAARPSVGKTAFALQIAKNVSMNTVKKEPVGFFSLEMATKKLIPRFIASEAMIDMKLLNSSLIQGEDWEKYTMAHSILADASLIIDDDPNQTVQSIKAKSRRMMRELGGLSMILIDYLQLIQGPRAMSRYDLVSENTRQLKILARELDVPVIALSQLSRSVEQRADKRPMMSDLRESGSIEQDADIVAFLHRDDYYDKASEKKNLIEIIIAKQRNGPVGTVELAFLKQYNKFTNLDRTHLDQQKIKFPNDEDDKEKQKRRYA